MFEPTYLITSQLLRSQACKTSTFQSSYFVRIVNLWNYVCKTAPSNSYNTLLLQNIPPQDLPPTYCHCLHGNWSFRPLAVSSPCRFVPLPFRPLAVSSPCRFVPRLDTVLSITYFLNTICQYILLFEIVSQWIVCLDNTQFCI
jgi:hypothetical protein